VVLWTDQKIHSFARDLAKLCIRVDIDQAEGSSGPLQSAMRHLFQEKLAELAKALGSEEEAKGLLRRYIPELQEEMARKPGRDRSHRGQEQAVTFAHRWIDAWQSRRLTRLLSLFDDDGSYINTILNIAAYGKRELGRPFGRMLHDRTSLIEVTEAVFDAGRTAIHWKRTSTLVDGVRASLPSSIVFEGTTVFDIADDLVLTCYDDWSGLTQALQHMPFGKESPTPRDAPVIVMGVDTVWIGGLALPRQPQRFQ
jgi:SnoaL-like domain